MKVKKIKKEGWQNPEISVKALREILQDALDYLEDYDEGEVVHCRSNTYGLNNPMLEVRQGFIELRNMDVYSPDED